MASTISHTKNSNKHTDEKENISSEAESQIGSTIPSTSKDSLGITKKKHNKAGRKPLDDSNVIDKRIAQNRAAQRAFRERKERRMKELEKRVEELEQIREQSEMETDFLRKQVSTLVDALKRANPEQKLPNEDLLLKFLADADFRKVKDDRALPFNKKSGMEDNMSKSSSSFKARESLQQKMLSTFEFPWKFKGQQQPSPTSSNSPLHASTKTDSTKKSLSNNTPTSHSSSSQSSSLVFGDGSDNNDSSNNLSKFIPGTNSRSNADSSKSSLSYLNPAIVTPDNNALLISNDIDIDGINDNGFNILGGGVTKVGNMDTFSSINTEGINGCNFKDNFDEKVSTFCLKLNEACGTKTEPIPKGLISDIPNESSSRSINSPPSLSSDSFTNMPCDSDITTMNNNNNDNNDNNDNNNNNNNNTNNANNNTNNNNIIDSLGLLSHNTDGLSLTNSWDQQSYSPNTIINKNNGLNSLATTVATTATTATTNNTNDISSNYSTFGTPSFGTPSLFFDNNDFLNVSNTNANGKNIDGLNKDSKYISPEKYTSFTVSNNVPLIDFSVAFPEFLNGSVTGDATNNSNKANSAISTTIPQHVIDFEKIKVNSIEEEEDEEEDNEIDEYDIVDKFINIEPQPKVPTPIATNTVDAITNVASPVLSEYATKLTGEKQQKTYDGKAQNCMQEIANEVVPNTDSNLLKCSEVWDRITTHPRYTDIDIDGLCIELRNKAKCSDKGVVINKQDLNAALESSFQ
ncbi:uncharacterized protein SCDLUD_003308 [Saccharomycodes ludwigii]|uniref:uncharacterized protein n=1 Tax=Saccharomycodes ludwigii TaxID=36035 RepID=UPI001E8C4EEF|nr:hypothetical protein SCDLUD_003308 [Saccharomycodes ludwigii]KAH3900334.1 hypothetical protein SCDLUD_003308 [Saccharomycodes ludwigii]